MLNSTAVDTFKDCKQCEVVSGHTGQIRDDLNHVIFLWRRNVVMFAIVDEDVAAVAVDLPPTQSDAGLSLCTCPKLRWIQRLWKLNPIPNR